MDPNTLNLDQDPGFWSNLDPDPVPDPVLCFQVLNKKIKVILEKNNFLNKNYRYTVFVKNKNVT